MKTGIGVLLLALATAVLAQEEERLWMPEGYRLLTLEERQTLPREEQASIGTRNRSLIDEAVKGMTPEERHRIVEALGSYGKRPQATDVEKQYISMTSMQLLSAALEEHGQKEKRERADRLAALLKEQEETTKGFPSDQKSVEAESQEIHQALERRQSSRKLYLSILKPLRARPWNRWARFVFYKVLRYSPTELLEPALAFVRAREKESPNEGAWPSLHAYLLLSFKGEVAEAKRLFSLAIAKEANDLDSRVFPLLIAEIEQNEADIARYLPRAQREWPKAEDLEKVLYDEISGLPSELQSKARRTFQVKYKTKHPADWEARRTILAGRFWDKDYGGIETEAATVLALPASILPEPHRTEIAAIQLRAKAGLGKCAEAAAGIPRLEAKAEALYPPRFDPNVAPQARTEADVRQLRASMKEMEEHQKLLERWSKGDFREAPEDLSGTPNDERREFLEQAIAEINRNLAQTREILNGRDAPAAAAEWSRRDHAEWEERQGVAKFPNYDIRGRADAISVATRGAAGRCFLEKGDPLAAVRLLRPCAGSGKNRHATCSDPLVDAAVLLAKSGHLREAVAVYELFRETNEPLSNLFHEIEKVAPGSVKPQASRTVTTSIN